MAITYLAGGINGLTDAECNDWRQYAKDRLSTATLDPMRRDYRGVEDDLYADIVDGDKADIEASDALLVNAIRPSWGTAMEIMYAYERGKQVFAVVPEGQRVSPWLRYFTTLFPTLDDAIEAINQGWGY